MKYQITIEPKGEMPSLILMMGIALETYAINCEPYTGEPKPPIAFLTVDLPEIDNAEHWRTAIANVLRLRFGADCNVSISEKRAEVVYDLHAGSAGRSIDDGESGWR